MFSPGRTGALWRVAATGGVAEPVTVLDRGRQEVTHRWPRFLPDGRRFVYWASGNSTETRDQDSVRLGDLENVASGRVLLEKSSNAVISAGHLLYERYRDGGARLLAQPFDVGRGEVSGVARPLVELNTDGAGVSLLRVSVSEGGDLIYLGMPGEWQTNFSWWTLGGAETAVLVGEAPWFEARLSPDGGRVSVSMTNLQDGNSHVWIVDAATGARRRLTFEPGDAFGSIWSPDGRRVAYATQGRKQDGIYARPSAGGAEELLVATSEIDEGELDSSPDGRFVLFQVWNAAAGSYDVRLLDLSTRRVAPFLTSAADEGSPRWAPGGGFVAYSSNESRAMEVYLRRFPGEEKWQLSVDGGRMPRWSPDGREVYFVRPDGRLAAVPLTLDADVSIGQPRVAVDRRLPLSQWFTYELHPDGKRLLVDSPPPETREVPVRLLLNWPALLER